MFAAVAGICLAGALAGVPVWAFVVGNALAAGLALADWRAADPGGIDLDRADAGPFSIGRENPVHLRIRNRGERPVEVIVGDAAPAGADLAPVRHALTAGVGEDRNLEAVVVPSRRGPVRFAAAEVRVIGPMRLAFRERSFPATAREAVAWPDVMRIRDERLLPPGRRIGGMRSIRAETSGREFESLREYVRGDEYRRISWKATARRGSPVVVNHRAERGQTVLLALEAGRLMHGAGGEGLGKLDRAVNAGVMLAAVAREYDDAVGVLVFAGTPIRALPPSARPGQLRRAVDVVAGVEPELVEPDWRAGVHALSRMSRRRAVAIVFSDALYAQTDDRLAGRLGALARRLLVVFASIRDAEVTELAERPVTDAATLFERGVASEILEQRDAALQAMRRLGVHTLDSSPERLTTEIVARFRELRAT